MPGDKAAGWVSVGVSCLAFGVAVWSTRTARANLRIASGNAVSRLLDAYASPEMDRALAALRLAQKPMAMHQNGEFQDASNFQQAVHMALKATFGGSPDQSSEAMMTVLRNAGRRVHWFVKQADILRRNGALTDDLFRQAVAETNGYRLWAEVWLPYLKANPIGGQPENHLAWANVVLTEIPPIGGTD